MVTMEESNAASVTPKTRPRRPAIAVLLTILLPGLGHLYAATPARALSVWFVISVLGLVVVWIGALLPGRLSIAWIPLAGVGVLAAAAWDAARTAKRSDSGFVLRRYNRWYVYAGVVITFAFLIQPRYVMLLRPLLQAYQIPGRSMEPTLLVGDYVFATPIRGMPTRGQLVIYRRGNNYIKRIVAVGGDTVAMRANTLFVNLIPVPEGYTWQPFNPTLGDPEFAWQRRFLPKGIDPATYHPTISTWGPIVVPSGQYFILGDNRGASADSRYQGFVPVDSIAQVPTVVYFSRDPESGSVRWNRIGQVPH